MPTTTTTTTPRLTCQSTFLETYSVCSTLHPTHILNLFHTSRSSSPRSSSSSTPPTRLQILVPLFPHPALPGQFIGRTTIWAAHLSAWLEIRIVELNYADTSDVLLSFSAQTFREGQTAREGRFSTQVTRLRGGEVEGAETVRRGAGGWEVRVFQRVGTEGMEILDEGSVTGEVEERVRGEGRLCLRAQGGEARLRSG